MKKIIFFLSISILSCIELKAQQPSADPTKVTPADTVKATPPAQEKEKAPKDRKPEKRFMYGAQGGVSSTFFSNSPAGYSVSNSIGFNAGIYIRVYIFKRLYVQPEFNYYFSSYDFTRSIDGQGDKVKAHALQIPVLAGYTLINHKAFHLLVQTGPAISINVGVSDNDLGVTRDDFNSTYWDWIVDGQMRLGRRVIVNGGFVAGMSNYAYGERAHSWYVGMGFNL